ncbi:phosphotransferase [Parabacteroides sp. PF5-6]|uniref:phosphotransferase n=1 Tax=Parabacteroides sp. PF5-6 TaxID=1742403 RepID=UPI0024065C79|nr:phosphotransferase [Parabacteroides sp. PF5-6]MDF9831681.1 putative metal-dependent phosphoesterase TrpH [Parabacteroides sp. PF5-6]
MRKKCFCVLFGLMAAVSLQAQLRNEEVYEVTEMNRSAVRTEVRIPGFDGWQTLKCDFHTHTVFSDGQVWPDIRVGEAWRQGLDAVAITDHIEYRPNKEVVLGDLNQSYILAKKRGDAIGFIVIKGMEITRSKPLGHLNALFLDDSLPLDVEDPLKAIDAAIAQGAFVMWNHPGWPDDRSTLYPVHEQLIREKKIHGLEVFNSMEYYPVCFNWARDMNLSFMANSDIHGLINDDYGTGMRPMTLVFAREKSAEAIKEALFAGRTAACFNHELAGLAEYLRPLVKASLQVRKIHEGAYEVMNVSDINYRMTAGGQLFIVPAGKTIAFRQPQADALVIENCHVGSAERLTLSMDEFLNR